MTEKEEFGEALLNLLQSPVAKQLTAQERIDVVGMARSEMRVPATIWSPEDLLGFIPEDVTHPQAVAEELWENLDVETTEEEWYAIQAYVEWELDHREEG